MPNFSTVIAKHLLCLVKTADNRNGGHATKTVVHLDGGNTTKGYKIGGSQNGLNQKSKPRATKTAGNLIGGQQKGRQPKRRTTKIQAEA